MFDGYMRRADLTGYTEEEIALATELHERYCPNGCKYGPFVSMFNPYANLELARRMIADRPQKDVLF
jgi:hypothetical protein